MNSFGFFAETTVYGFGISLSRRLKGIHGFELDHQLP